jgi:enamine deaminase RidA (YjgF/YER057c/UK114 family)
MTVPASSGDRRRRHSWPEGHWGWLIPVTHKHGLRAGPMAFVGGQVDKDTRGLVLHPYDRATQTAIVMSHIGTVLRDLGLTPASLVKLVAFYASEGGAADEAALLRDIAGHLAAPGPAITAVPVPYLAYPGMLVEIEAIAMAGVDGMPLPRVCAPAAAARALPAPLADGVRCGDMIYLSGPAHGGGGPAADPPGSEAEAARAVAGAGRALADLGAGLEDVVKLVVYYLDTAGGRAVARVLPAIARGFGQTRPVVTAIPLPWLPDGESIRLDVVAMRGAESALPRTHATGVSPWDWPGAPAVSQGLRVGRMVHVGAQMPLAGNGVLAPGALVPQTRAVMALVGRVLAGLGAGMDDVVKVNAFYRSGGTAEDLNANLGVRSSCFTAPGPTTTGIPVPFLALGGVAISVDVLAMLE